jgi:hypothetical protein
MTPRHIRDRRAAVQDRLKRGSASLSQVLREAQADDVINGMRVSVLLESLPGIGEAGAVQIMNRLGIAESGLVRDLTAGQRTALEAESGRPAAPVGPESGQVTPDEDYDDDEGVEPEAMPGLEDWDR